jgi:hypothetical protein
LDIWINQFANDLLVSYGITGLIILFFGTIFLIVSFLVRASLAINKEENSIYR